MNIEIIYIINLHKMCWQSINTYWRSKIQNWLAVFTTCIMYLNVKIKEIYTGDIHNEYTKRHWNKKTKFGTLMSSQAYIDSQYIIE